MFDFGGTIDADGLPWSTRFYLAFTREGLRLPFAEFDQLFKESDQILADWMGIREAGFRSMISFQARSLARLLRLSNPVARRAGDRFYATAKATVTRNRELFAGLKRQHRLGVISNFTGNLELCLRELELTSFFDVVADSAVVGHRKPGSALFKWAAERMHADGTSFWMIGDNFEADIRPARTLGWSSCWLAPGNRPLPEDGVASARIESLPALISVLEQFSCTR
jgi:putative hydrolase of the HAD superfamily